jgi:hypothetical protein
MIFLVFKNKTVEIRILSSTISKIAALKSGKRFKMRIAGKDGS